MKFIYSLAALAHLLTALMLLTNKPQEPVYYEYYYEDEAPPISEQETGKPLDNKQVYI